MKTTYKTFCPHCNEQIPLSTTADQFWIHVDKTINSPCWTWSGYIHANGYGRIVINRKEFLAHRIAWELTYGPIPKDLIICHSCDNRLCVNPSHLFLGTDEDNAKDKERKGRGNHAKGSRTASAKLVESQVREMRNLYDTGQATVKVLAKMYGLHTRTVFDIVRRKTWKHVD